jgi:hypothetical protein
VPVEILGEIDGRQPEQRPRLAVEQLPVERAKERLSEGRGGDQNLLPWLYFQAPRAQQLRERIRIDHGA